MTRFPRAVWPVFSLIILLVLGTTGCGSPSNEGVDLFVENDPTPMVQSTSSQNTDQEQPYQIGLVMKTLTNPFFVEMEKGARQAEAEFGVALTVKTGAQETSVEQQISIVRSMIQEGMDAIVIAPADSAELIPSLKEAQDAGIVIVNIDNRLDTMLSQSFGLADVPFISVNNEEGAYLSAKYISDQISEPTQVAILEGIRTAQNAEDRKQGALRAFGDNPLIQVVSMQTANWQIDEAYRVTSQIFGEHPEIGAIFAANDMMAFGAIRFLQESGRGDVLVAAYDALDEAKTAIRNGELQSTIDQQAAMQGYAGVEFAVRLLDGEPVSELVLVDVKLITRETLEAE
jgi:ribose transport system substrate-binding protein